MKTTVYFCALLAGAVVARSAAAGDAKAALEQFLLDTTTVSAGFRQELTDADGSVVEIARGTLTIARPDRLRWDYAEPDQTIVADGERLWLFDREVDQVTVTGQDEGLRGSPAALLGGGPEVLDTFTIKRSFTADGNDWVVLTPLADDVDFTEVGIAFQGDTLALMRLSDQLGQTTTLEFADVALNGPVKDSAFTLEIPDYVDVVDNVAAPMGETDATGAAASQ